MAWSKLKNIIILMLLGVNLMLAGLALFYWQREAVSQKTAMENAVAILEEQGVSLETKLEEMSLPVMAVQRDQAREDVLAAALLGEADKEDRGAGVYRYTSDRGMIQFHSNGEFSAAFPAGAFLLEGQAPEEHALDMLELLDFQGQVLSVREKEGITTVVVCQQFNGTPLLSCQAVLEYEGGCLIAIAQGRRLNGTPYPDMEAERPISAASALIRFVNGVRELGDVSKTITRVEESYLLSSTLTGPARMTPVWYITTDTGSYQLNGLTGDLTLSSEMNS